MKESLRAKPPSTSRIDIELWARDLRWQWVKRAFRSLLGRLATRAAPLLAGTGRGKKERSSCHTRRQA
jgi:hypothetical protein